VELEGDRDMSGVYEEDHASGQKKSVEETGKECRRNICHYEFTPRRDKDRTE
jgi:hypothetical protein